MENKTKEENPMIQVVEDSKGNVGLLTVKFLAEISYNLKLIANNLENKGK